MKILKNHIGQSTTIIFTIHSFHFINLIYLTLQINIHKDDEKTDNQRWSFFTKKISMIKFCSFHLISSALITPSPHYRCRSWCVCAYFTFAVRGSLLLIASRFLPPPHDLPAHTFVVCGPSSLVAAAPRTLHFRSKRTRPWSDVPLTLQHVLWWHHHIELACKECTSENLFKGTLSQKRT